MVSRDFPADGVHAMDTAAPRAPITREALATLLASAGLPLSPDELDGLLPPVAAIYAAIDGLDALPLAGTEPAPTYTLSLSAPAGDTPHPSAGG
jgi:hypothetical protein